MPNTETPSIANMWVYIELSPGDGVELVLTALGATERRIPFTSYSAAKKQKAAETLRYMDAVNKQRQAQA